MAKRSLGTFVIFAGLVLAWQLLHWIGGETALAFSNPLYVDVDGGGWTAPGVHLTP